jgi:hypothetical protein
VIKVSLRDRLGRFKAFHSVIATAAPNCLKKHHARGDLEYLDTTSYIAHMKEQTGAVLGFHSTRVLIYVSGAGLCVRHARGSDTVLGAGRSRLNKCSEGRLGVCSSASRSAARSLQVHSVVVLCTPAGRALEHTIGLMLPTCVRCYSVWTVSYVSGSVRG